MARKKKTTRTYTPKPKVTRAKGGGVVVVSQPAAPRSIIRRAGRRVGEATNNASIQTRIKAAFFGGMVLGFIEKTFGDKLPALPYVGKRGTIAGAVYFLKPKNKMLQDAGIVAAGLAGNQLVKENRIEGDDEDFIES